MSAQDLPGFDDQTSGDSGGRGASFKAQPSPPMAPANAPPESNGKRAPGHAAAQPPPPKPAAAVSSSVPPPPQLGESPPAANRRKSLGIAIATAAAVVLFGGGYLLLQSLTAGADQSDAASGSIEVLTPSSSPPPGQADEVPETAAADDPAVDLDGVYSGTIKDGTRWYVYIRDFNGSSFVGSNDIYWPRSPQGFKTNFTGTYDPATNQITMDEDRNAQGSGQFLGQVFADGETMSGTWTLYSGGTSFTWNLVRE